MATDVLASSYPTTTLLVLVTRTWPLAEVIVCRFIELRANAGCYTGRQTQGVA